MKFTINKIIVINNKLVLKINKNVAVMVSVNKLSLNGFISNYFTLFCLQYYSYIQQKN